MREDHVKTQTHRERYMTVEAETAVLERQGNEFQRYTNHHGPGNALISDSSPRNHERILLCCFRLPQFVVLCYSYSGKLTQQSYRWGREPRGVMDKSYRALACLRVI